MVLGFGGAPLLPISSEHEALSPSHAAGGSWQPPSLPSARSSPQNCGSSPTREMDDPWGRAWAHTQHSAVTWQSLVKQQMEKSEDTQFPRFLSCELYPVSIAAS